VELVGNADVITEVVELRVSFSEAPIFSLC